MLGNMIVGNNGKGSFYKEVGHVYVDGLLEIGGATGSTGHVCLHDGGVINTHTFGMRADGGIGTMEIYSDGGMLIIDGDVQVRVQGYIDSGWIKCFAEKCCDSPVVDFDNNYPGRTAVYCVAKPVIAWNPRPFDDDNCVEPNAILSWQAGIGAVSHDVYLGTIFNDVSSATTASPEYKGRQSSTTYYPGTLVPCTTYYWRIDEVNDSNVAWKGCIWTFTTCCCKEAIDPRPADYADCVEPNVVLSWQPGFNAILHDVYFGTGFEAVDNATTLSVEYMGRQAFSSYVLGGLAEKTWYYWRIDEICESGFIVKGRTWRFRTGPCCVDPPESIVAWWPLNEGPTPGGISHEIVHNNDGLWIGSPVPVTGKVRGALDFNNTGDYVQVPNNAYLNFGTGDFSIDAWVKWTPRPGIRVILDKRSGTESNPRGYRLYLTGAGLGLQLADGTYTNYIGLPVSGGNWHHVAATVDRDVNDGLKLYVDGVSQTFDPRDRQGDLTNDANLLIAANSIGSGGPSFWGAIDEVQLYNKALDVNEILAIFNADTEGKCEPCPNDTPSVIYDVVSDWSPGEFNSVKVSDDCNGSLMLLDPNDPCAATPFPYAWIPNSGDGTISKVNILTGKEEARYYTGPPIGMSYYSYLSPSRTTLDKYGNCWVANRSFGYQGSVTKILRNPPPGNTSVDGGDGVISPDEMFQWGEDVAVERHYLVGDSTTDNVPRALAVDQQGYLWVGLYFGERCVKLDADETTPGSFSPVNNASLRNYSYAGAPRPTEKGSVKIDGFHPYGMALSPNGRLYVCFPIPDYGVAEIEPVTATLCQICSMLGKGDPYSLAVAQDCIVWMADYEAGRCIRWDPTLHDSGFTFGTGAAGIGRGITIHPDGSIWMACNSYDAVAKFNPGLAPVAVNYWSLNFSTPVGIGVGSDGSIIVSSQGNSKWTKLNSTTGAEISLAPAPQLVGSGPYVYSDFTGNLLNQAQQQGFWTRIFDSKRPGEKWGKAWWNSIEPPNTSVSIEVRAADTYTDLASRSYEKVEEGKNFEYKGIMGQYIQVRVQLSRNRPSTPDCNSGCGEMPASPKLCWLKVQAACPPCHLICPNDIEVYCETRNPDGAYVIYPDATFDVDGDCNTTLGLTYDHPKGWFPVGVTLVTCEGQGSNGDPVKCSFNVTVKPCPDPNGACCYTTRTRSGIVWGCETTTRQDCNNRLKGVYRGDNQPCPNDVNDCNCVRPPKNAVAWWPLDEKFGLIANDIAGYNNKGAYFGTPAPIPASGKVAYGLGFSGSGGYVRVANHPEINFGLGNMSIDAWVKTDSSKAILPIVEKMTDVELATGYSLFLLYGQLAFAVCDPTQPGYGVCVAPGPDIADDTWHHVAVTFNRGISDLKLYVDGEVVATCTETQITGSLTNSSDLYIGRSAALIGSDTFFTGVLDEIEMFKRALPQNEIRDLYKRELGKCKETASVTSFTPCCYYPYPYPHTIPASVYVQICNYRDTEQTYSWFLNGNQNSTMGCNIAGTTLGPGTITVPAGQCKPFKLTFSCPSGLPLGGTACSELTVRNDASNTLISDFVKLISVIKWCPHIIYYDTMPITYPGEVRRFVFEVTNTDDPCGVLPYKIEARDSAGNPDIEALILNGQPPGTAVEGVIEAEPNGTVQVTVDVELAGYEPFDSYDLVLSADSDGDGNSEDLLSATVTGIPCGASHYRFLAGDLDENCFINFMDFAKIASDWLAEPQNPEWDIGMPPDDVINYKDIYRMVDSWLEMGMRP
ncbi:MAG: LamG-like jellyroll fold domain-containing protein [Sedimentisphaerales bacterium]